MLLHAPSCPRHLACARQVVTCCGCTAGESTSGAVTSVLSSQSHDKDHTTRLHQVGTPRHHHALHTSMKQHCQICVCNCSVHTQGGMIAMPSQHTDWQRRRSATHARVCCSLSNKLSWPVQVGKTIVACSKCWAVKSIRCRVPGHLSKVLHMELCLEIPLLSRLQQVLCLMQTQSSLVNIPGMISTSSSESTDSSGEFFDSHRTCRPNYTLSRTQKQAFSNRCLCSLSCALFS